MLFIGDLDFQAFRKDDKTIRTIELNFIIIGETATGIPEEFQEAHPNVPWHFMRHAQPSCDIVADLAAPLGKRVVEKTI